MKILDITGNPFSKVLNNGKTHEALFSEFSSSELCQLYVHPVNYSYIDFDYCNSYFCVSDWDVLNRCMMRSEKCGSNVLPTEENFEVQVEKYKNVKKNGILATNGLLGIIRDMLWSTKVWKTKELMTWLRAEAPDIIFMDGGGDCYMYDIGLFVKQELNIPMITYFTDDFFLYTLRDSFFKKIHISSLEKKLHTVVKQSSLCYAIGEKMAEDYSKFFSVDFLYIMNSADIKPLVPLQNKYGLLNISYFGNLGLNRGNMILRLGKLLKDIATINVYSFEISDNLAKEYIDNGIIYHGGVKGAAFENAIAKSDVLLHVESDDKSNKSFTKLAISTKIPEYLMNGKPILAFGPKEIASMEIIYKNNIGLFVNSESLDSEIIKNVAPLMDFQYRLALVQNSYEYAVKHFDRKKNSIAFRENIVKIIEVH